MRAVIQRVSDASVSIEGAKGTDEKGTDAACGAFVSGRIDTGLLVYLGVALGDTETDAVYLADKIANLRIFMDADEKMNLSALDVGQPILVVSQFTLMADVRKGRRPSWSQAAEPAIAKKLYEHFCAALRRLSLRVETGQFQAMMRVAYINEGPITILLDSRKEF